MSNGLDDAINRALDAELAPVSPLDSSIGHALDAELGSRSAQLGHVLDRAAQSNPDRAARVARLAQITGAAPDLVDRNLDAFEAELGRQGVNPAALVSNAPLTAAWLADPEHAAVAHDDAAPLSTLEWINRYFTRPFHHAVVTFDDAMLATAQKAGINFGTLVPSLRAKLQEEAAASVPDAKTIPQRIVSGAAQAIPTLLAVGATGGGAVAGGATATGTFGITSGSMYLQTVGHRMEAFRNLRTVDGQPIDPLVADSFASASAALESLILAKGFGAFLGPSATRAATSAGVANALEKAAARPAVGAALKRLALTLGEKEAEAAATMVLQQAVASGMAEAAKATAPGRFEHASPREFVQQLSDTAVQSLIDFAAITAVSGGADFARDVVAIRGARASQARAEQLTAAAEASKLRTRLPDAFEQFTERVTAGSDAERVYMTPEAWDRAWAARGEDPAARWAVVTEKPELYDDAALTGGDLEIPTAKWLARLTPEEQRALFVDARFHAEDMTPREAEQAQGRPSPLASVVHDAASVARDFRSAQGTIDLERAAREIGAQINEAVRAGRSVTLTHRGQARELAAADARGLVDREMRAVPFVELAADPQARLEIAPAPAVDAPPLEASAAAQHVRTAAAAYPEAPLEGMSAEELAQYRELSQRALTEAETRLVNSLASRQRRTQEAAYRAERARVLAEVEAEAAADPAYQALHWLQTGRSLDGAEVRAVPAKLDAQAVAELLTPEELARFRREHPFTMTTAAGEHPDSVAEVFGFPSGCAMLAAMLARGPRRAGVDAKVDAIMERVAPTRLTADQLREAAQEAVHTEERAQLLAAQLSALQRRTGLPAAPATAIRESVSRQLSETLAFEIRPDKYRRAEQKAARAAFQAAARGDLAGAVRAKERELAAFQAYRLAVEARDGREQAVGYLERMGKDAARSRVGLAGGGFGSQIDRLLARFGLRDVAPNEPAREQNLAAWLRDLAETTGADVDVADWLLDESYTKPVRALTWGELQDLRNAVTNLETLAMDQNRVVTAQGEADLSETTVRLIASAEAALKDRGPIKTSRDLRTIGDRLRKLGQRADASMVRAEWIIGELDNGRVDGPWHELFTHVAAKASKHEMDLTERFAVSFAKALQDMPAEVRRGLGDRAGIADIVAGSRIHGDISRLELLEFIAQLGNEDNYQRLRDGWALTDEQISRVADTVKREEWQLVQQLGDILEGLYPEIAALERATKGIEPKRVERRPVATKWGTLAGWYWPLVYDPRYGKAGERQFRGGLAELFPQGYLWATTPKGHTKARQAKVNDPPLLDINIIPSHIAQVAKDLAWRRAVLSMNKILQQPAIIETLQRHLGEGRAGLLMDWLRDVASDRTVRRVDADGVRFWTDFVTAARSNAVAAAIGLKATAIIPNISDLALIAEVTGSRHVVKALTDFVTRPTESYREARDRSFELAHRFKNTNRDLRDNFRRLGLRTDIRAQAQRAYMYGMLAVDVAVSYVGWKAAYDHGITLGYEGENLIHYADGVIRTRLQTGGTKDLPAVMRSNNEGMRLWTTFYGWFNQRYNTQRDIAGSVARAARQDGAAGVLKITPRVLIRSWWAVAIPALLGEALANRARDDNETWAEWTRRKLLTFPFMGVLGARELAGAFDTPGKPRLRLPLALDYLHRVAWKVPERALEAWKNDDSAELAAAASEEAGLLVGAPVAQAKLTGGYLWDVYHGIEKPNGPVDFARGVVYGKRR